MSEPTSRHELFYHVFQKGWYPQHVPQWGQLTFDEQTRWVAFYNQVELWLTGKKKCPILNVEGLDPWATVNVTERVNELQLAYDGRPASPGPRTSGGAFSPFLNLPGDLAEEEAVREKEEKLQRERIERLVGKLDTPAKRYFPDDPEERWEAGKWVSDAPTLPEEDFIPFGEQCTRGGYSTSTTAENEAIITQAQRIVEKYATKDEEEVENDTELSEEEGISLVTHLPDPHVPLAIRLRNRAVAYLWKKLIDRAS